MAVLNFLITIAAVIAVLCITGKVMKRHPYYGKANIPLGAPKTLLVLVASMFALTCVWQFALETLDEMRTPGFWIGMFSADPVLSDVFQTADEYDVDLGIPTGEYGKDALIMISKVMESFATAFWLAMAGLVVYAVYILGLFKRSRVTLYACLIALGVIFIFAGRAAGAGVIHIVNWVTSGIYNHYNGDMSDSVMLPFYTDAAAIIAGIVIVKGFPKINRFIAYDPISKDTKAAGMPELETPQCRQSNPQDIFANENKSKAEKLAELKSLLDAGILTETEFTNMKRIILNS